ncbi:uncharacterized protein LOC129273404 [Lytechinus pictus]|uniref:uncharacterized protein LOC129273404 n=1 Tax=Lytechinus pictus TaxID=7653 RepID=UPI0030B9EB77
MQLQMMPADTGLSSSESDSSSSSIKMTLGSPSSPSKLRGTFTLSSATVDPLTNFDSWPTTTGFTSKAITEPRPGVGRGRLPSIGELNPASKLVFPAQQSFMQMFTTPGTDGSIYSKRKNLYAGYHQQAQGRPVKDRIIKHNQPEVQNKSRVEPLPEETDVTNAPKSFLQGSGLLEPSKNVWTAPSDMTKGPKHVALFPTRSPPSKLTAQRETVTIDGKIRRVRFLSADHTPLREDPEFKKLLGNTKTVSEINRKTAPDTKAKPTEDKKVNLRSVTVSRTRKASLDGGEGGKILRPTPKLDSKQESPDVWLERARKLRASKDKNAKKTEGTCKQSESMKFHEEENNMDIDDDKTLCNEIKHVNYCDEKKTRWVVRWLEEVNRQSHFDIIE